MKTIALMSALISASLASNSDRIVNGQVISTSLYPFMVSLEAGDFHFCGGALIRAEAPAIVLTAAHCWSDNYTLTNNSFQSLDGRNYFAVLGRDSVQPPSSDSTYMNVSITMAKVHADYVGGFDNSSEGQSGVNQYDVALVRLDGNVSSFMTSQLYPDDSCCTSGDNFTIMGYGAAYSDGPATQYFERAYQQNVAIDYCNRWFVYALKNNLTNASALMHLDLMSSDYDYLDNLTIVGPGNLCAFSYTQDTCQGDSGGPMLETSSGKQVGIVSWGLGCASATPGVYTDVGYYSGWIEAASACLVYMGQDVYDNAVASACDKLCEYEDIECTHYAMDMESTTAGPNTNGGGADGGVDGTSMAVSFAPLVALMMALISIVMQ
jgi:V8-like Glu-specific endopeptidase